MSVVAPLGEPPLGAWAVLIDGLPDATWIVDAHSRRVVADNAAARTLLGRLLGGLEVGRGITPLQRTGGPGGFAGRSAR